MIGARSDPLRREDRPTRDEGCLSRALPDGWYPLAKKEEYGMRAALNAKELVSYYSWEGNLDNAKKQVAPACEALRAKGVEAAVDVYAGSLKKAVRAHAINGDVHLIMSSAGMGNWATRLLDGTISIFRLFKRPGFFPVGGSVLLGMSGDGKIDMKVRGQILSNRNR
jgi:hypothetical protein